MANCPLADDCPQFQERIQGMGCQHYGDRGGAEWCNHYDMPIEDLKAQPVKPGEELVVEIEDIHESGAGVGRTEDGFIILVDGVLPPARSKIRVDRVKRNHARANEVERLATEGEEEEAAEETDEEGTTHDQSGDGRPEALGSRDNFWGS
jgi:predicted RNA-binding protein with TRAM domain